MSDDGQIENGRLLKEIHETVVRVDERTLGHTSQISALFDKQNEACAKLATLEERTSSHAEQLAEARRRARRSGGGAGAAIAGAALLLWELIKRQVWGNGGP